MECGWTTKNSDDFNADDDDLVDEEPLTGEKPSSQPPLTGQHEENEKEEADKTHMPSDAQLQHMADNILDQVVHNLLDEAAKAEADEY